MILMLAEVVRSYVNGKIQFGLLINDREDAGDGKTFIPCDELLTVIQRHEGEKKLIPQMIEIKFVKKLEE
jgi:hypothetical protein